MDVVKVGSRLFIDLTIDLEGFAEKFVIRGLSHPSTDGMAVTEDVPAEAFRKWFEANADYAPIATGSLFEVPEGHDTSPQPKEYGFQPALDRLANDPEQRKLAEQGVPDEDLAVLVPGGPGVAVALPNPIPTPPSTVTRQRPVAQPVPTEAVTTQVNDPATWRPAPAADDPKLDINLKGPGQPGPSSNQTGTQPNAQAATGGNAPSVALTPPAQPAPVAKPAPRA